MGVVRFEIYLGVFWEIWRAFIAGISSIYARPFASCLGICTPEELLFV